MRPASSQQSKIERLGFKDARFGWRAQTDDMMDRHFQLGPLNLDFPLGQISLITGATGSGKSTLLAALLGGKETFFSTEPAANNPVEMYCLSGKVFISKSNHQVALCAQNPCKHALVCQPRYVTLIMK